MYKYIKLKNMITLKIFSEGCALETNANGLICLSFGVIIWVIRLQQINTVKTICSKKNFKAHRNSIKCVKISF